MKKTQNRWLWPSAILIALVVIVGGLIWSSNKTDTINPELNPIKIGLSAPLTGGGAEWGKNALAAATLAVQEANDKGGINGRKIELIAEDDKATAESVNVFNKLINIDKVAGIVGPVASSSAGPALPIAQKAGVPVVMLASAPDLINVGDYMFRVYPSDAYQGSVAADVVYNKLSKKKTAIIYVNNDYGIGTSGAFEKKYNALGGNVVYKGAVADNTTDFRSEITKMKSSGAEALYMVLYPDGALQLPKQLKEMGVDIPKVGDVVFTGENIVASESSEGIIFTEPKTEIKEDFVAKLKAQPQFKDLNVIAPAPFTYDATRALIAAIEKAGGDDHSKIKSALSKVSFKGASNPTIKFGSDREVLNPTFDVKVIKDKQVVLFEK